ncbi:hypothetical protein ACEXQE_09695 [Herbiconiux sp. P17]|uniref:hypothetical protein n=1 Tax=Herbiconiux wuyangfengii TaxID=3342794 RepID=UPI0035B9D6B1
MASAVAAVAALYLFAGAMHGLPAEADQALPDPLAGSVAGIPIRHLIAAGDALRAANVVEAYASTTFANTYSGVSLVDDSRQVVVYLAARDASVEAALASLVPTTQLQFEVREITRVAQQAVHDEVLIGLASLTEGGIDVASFGPDPETGAELVMVRNGTEQQLSQIQSTFGPAVSAVSVPDSYRAVADATRISDSAPWNAGDFISNRSEDCTSGIPTHNPAGQPFLVTAAHCFDLGAAVYNYSSAIPLGTARLMGHVAAQDLRDRYYDAELVSAAASNLTFTGPTGTSSKANFAGYGNPVPGALMCTSGAFEGEHCLTVIAVNSCLPNSTTGLGRTVCGENYYYSSNVQSIGQGDSGAPVYSYVSGGVRAMGLHNLHDPNYTTRCSNWSPQTKRICSGHGWFESIGPILTTWSLTVN